MSKLKRPPLDPQADPVPKFYPAMDACDVTGTRRFATTCNCPTYAGNGGSCATYEQGSNGRCVYCDHSKDCHVHPAAQTAPPGFVDLLAPAKTIAAAADQKPTSTPVPTPLAKIEVNDHTPRCPICRSVRIQEIRILGSFNRYCCVDCQASFRDPVYSGRGQGAA